MKIIVAFDATQESKEALQSAIELADETNRNITALYVVNKEVSQTETDGTGHPVIEGFDDALERKDRVLQTAENIADDSNIDVETDVVYGDPVEAILEYLDTYSDAANATLFVGHRAVASEKSSIGSVAQNLIRDSPVPVTVVN